MLICFFKNKKSKVDIVDYIFFRVLFVTFSCMNAFIYCNKDKIDLNILNYSSGAPNTTKYD